MKLDHNPATEEDWNMILSETVEEAICRVGYHLAGKVTIPLKVYRQWVDGLRFQLVETWCLSRYHQQHDPGLRRTGACVRDLRTCIDYLKALKIKVMASKRKLLIRRFVQDYDFNDAAKIEEIISDRFAAEKICDEAGRKNVARDFANGIMELIEVLSEESISTVGYLDATFGRGRNKVEEPVAKLVDAAPSPRQKWKESTRRGRRVHGCGGGFATASDT